MAIEWNAEYKRNSEYLFYPEEIVVPAEFNGRHDLPDLSELKKSIEKFGQLQPVGIRSDGGSPTLVFGFSRWQAISSINSGRPREERMRIRCVPVKCNEQTGFIANIHENRKRNAPTPLDDAHNILKLEQMGKSVAEIAEEYGESTAWVNGRLSLLSLAPEAQEALKTGKMKVTAAIAIAKLAAKQQKEKIANGQVKGERRYWSFGQVKDAMSYVVREGKAPQGYKFANRDEQDAVDRFCQWMLKNATGREA